MSEYTHAESNKIDVRTKNMPRELRLNKPVLTLTASEHLRRQLTRKTIAVTIYSTIIDTNDGPP
jgi:hypothetical protein